MAPRIPLYRQAQRQLKEYIRSHSLRPGDPLPPEATLAHDLGMSRLSLREAMKSLESLGIVDAQHGNGVFVRAFSFDPILENLPYSLGDDGRSLRELHQVREALEEGLIGMVMDRIGPSDLEALEAIVVEMDVRVKQGKPFGDQDRALHQRLFSGLDNSLVRRLIDLFWESYHRLEGEVVSHEPDPHGAVEVHRAVVRALRSGDRARAVQALTDHFASSRTRIAAATHSDSRHPREE
ncbi:MAG: FadR/GntR family transcriptional regulator [Chloroflexota bacterium]